LGPGFARPTTGKSNGYGLPQGRTCGDLGTYTPLSLFVGPELKPACAELVSGDLKNANQEFAKVLVKHYDNEGAYFGFVQSAGGAKSTYA